MKNATEISAALIGGGKISEQHLKKLSCMKDVRICGICDLSPALAEFTAERFGIRKWYTDYREMLTSEKPDIVHVLTPPATHFGIVRECLENGCNVIVEKPATTTNKDLHSLHDLAVSRNLLFTENHNYRFNRPVLKLRKAVDEGKLGTVKEIEIRLILNVRGGGRYADKNLPHPSHGLPAGIIHEFITHMVYLMLHFMPEVDPDAIRIIRAAWNNHGGGSLFKYDDLDAFLISGDTHCRLRFACNQWPDSFSVELRGNRGEAYAELYHPVCVVKPMRSAGKHLTPLINSVAESRTLFSAGFGSLWDKVRNRGAYDGLERYIERTYESLAEGGEGAVDFRQMDITSRLIERLLAEENRL